MNTSDLPKEISQAIAQADQAGSLNAAAAGLPDPAVVAKMANEFFRALEPPQSAVLPISANIPSTAGFVPALSAVELIPAQPQLRSLPATSQIPTGVNIPLPEIPGGISAGEYSTEPSFAFLEDARSLFAGAAVLPAQTAAVAAPFTFGENELRDLPSTLGGASIPKIPASVAELNSPQYAPAIPQVDRSGAVLFDFLNQIRTLDRGDAIPGQAQILQTLDTPSVANLSSGPFDVIAIRRDFPILLEKVNGRQLVWLDNAATTHKPQVVIDRLSYFYAHENSNIHRAAHTLAARATDAYEAAREKVRRFLNASSTKEIIFVRGATEAINLVAQSWGRRNVQKDDEIVITWLEHHANIVPWQMLCAEKGARLRVAPVDDSGQIILDEYEKLLNSKTKLVAVAHVSNALGTITPVEEMIAAAHRHGAKVLVDGAQAVSHMRVDVKAYDCDFYVFSGHKMFAPTGIGVVYGKADALENTPPWQGGGNMITDVTFEKTQYQTPPGRFEAGTGSIGDAVGLGAAIDYVERIGMVNIARYEHDLLVYATEAMKRIPGLRLIGTAAKKASVLSFVLDGFRTEDVGAALSSEGIAVRSGHHCAQPILRRFGVETTVRPSLALYNTCDDVDAMIRAIWNLKSGRNPGLV